MQQQQQRYYPLPSDIKNCEDLVRKSLVRIYTELVNAVDSAPAESRDNQSYLTMVSTSERCRLLVVELSALLKWTKNMDTLDRCQEMAIFFNQNNAVLQYIRDQLGRVSALLPAFMQPIFPLNSALSVLENGTYPFLPLVCDSRSLFQSKISMREGKALIMRILRTRIVTEDIPAFVSNISVEDSEIVCTEESLFTLYLSVIVGLRSCCDVETPARLSVDGDSLKADLQQ